MAVPVVVVHTTPAASDASQTGASQALTTQAVTTQTVTTQTGTTQTVTTQTGTPPTDGSPEAAAANSIVYQDVELPQDVCAQGRFLTFGKGGGTPTVKSAAATRPRRGSRRTGGSLRPGRRSRASSAPRS